MSARTRLALLGAAILLVSTGLTGCAGAPELAASTAQQLQSGVQTVSSAAAAGDYEGAQSALTAVQADLLSAAASGEVTAARSARIQSAINLVTADLASLVAAASPDPVTPSPTPSVDKHNDKGDGKNDKCRKKDDCGD